MEKTKAQIAAEETLINAFGKYDPNDKAQSLCKDIFLAGYNANPNKYTDEDMRNAYNAGIDNGYSSEEDVVFYSAEEWLANYKKED